MTCRSPRDLHVSSFRADQSCTDGRFGPVKLLSRPVNTGFEDHSTLDRAWVMSQGRRHEHMLPSIWTLLVCRWAVEPQQDQAWDAYKLSIICRS